MNATVQRIVELLFEDLEMTAEVEAIREEVMNNCQERFADMIARGLTEDEATGAVVESLKGMEEVLANYPRKAVEAQTGEDEHIFPAEAVQRIRVSLISDDVIVESSMDDMVHVRYDKEALPHVQVTREGQTLCIRGLDRARESRKAAHVHFNVKDVEIKSLEDIGRLLKNIRFTAAFNGDDVIRIALPDSITPVLDVQTTSGDVRVEDVCLQALNVACASGDIDVDLPLEVIMTRAEMRSSSGDIEAMLAAEKCIAVSMSGDVTLEGRICETEFSSMSGDVSVRGDVVRAEGKSVSGDVNVVCDSEELEALKLKSTSGDVDVRLPHGVRGVQLCVNSVSGDISYNVPNDPHGPVDVSVVTVSGDINVR